MPRQQYYLHTPPVVVFVSRFEAFGEHVHFYKCVLTLPINPQFYWSHVFIQNGGLYLTSSICVLNVQNKTT